MSAAASRAFQKECAHKCEHVVLGDGGNCGGKGKPFEDRIDEEVVEKGEKEREQECEVESRADDHRDALLFFLPHELCGHRCRSGEKAHRGRLDGKEETGADGDAGQIVCTDVTGHGRVHEVHADGGDLGDQDRDHRRDQLFEMRKIDRHRDRIFEKSLLVQTSKKDYEKRSCLLATPFIITEILNYFM